VIRAPKQNKYNGRRKLNRFPAFLLRGQCLREKADANTFKTESKQKGTADKK